MAEARPLRLDEQLLLAETAVDMAQASARALLRTWPAGDLAGCQQLRDVVCALLRARDALRNLPHQEAG